MLLLALALRGSAAEVDDWADLPAVWGLHPVTVHYGERYQAWVEQSMAGERAPAVFGPVVAEADLHWRLLAATGEGLPLDDTDAALWRDTALAGSLIAVNRVVDETVARSPQVQALRVGLDAILSPRIAVSRAEGEGLTVSHPTAGPRERAAELRDFEAAIVDRRRPPTIDAGFDWDLRDEEDDPRTPFLAYAPYLALSSVLRTDLRAELRTRTLQWAITGRHQLMRRTWVVGSVRSVPEAPDPGSWAVGAMWTPPFAEGWTARLDRTVVLGEQVRWLLSLRCERRTPIPGRAGHAPGATPGEEPWLPRVPNRDPLLIAPLAPPGDLPPEPRPTATSASEAPPSPGRR